MKVRPAAVAGSFYSADPGALRRDIEGFLDAAIDESVAVEKQPLKAIIAPHAGYVYSGPIAGSAFSLLRPLRNSVSRVVLLGPSHYVAFDGVATSGAEVFETPLGRVPVDTRTEQRLECMPAVRPLPEAHRPEHALEVELPFLQTALGDFEVCAMLIGEAAPDAVGAVLEELWGGDETLIVVSSDLSHFLDYDAARALDSETARRVLESDVEAGHSSLEPQQACGYRAINGLTRAVNLRGLQGRLLDLRSSGDTAGPHDRVVGYGAFAFA